MISKFAPSPLSIGILTVATSLSLANSVQAVSFNLSWTGNSGYYMTGLFSGNDTDADGKLHTNNTLSQNEITSINKQYLKSE